MSSGAEPPWAHRRGDTRALALRVQPGARRTEVVGPLGTVLKIRVGAPAADGKANAELVRFLAARLGVRRDLVRIVRGHTSRSKTVEVPGTASVEALEAAG